MKNKITLLFLTGFIFTINAQVCFTNQTNLTAGGHPYSVITADFTGDGILDLASTSIIDGPLPYHQVVIQRGLGDGTFAGLNGNSRPDVGEQPISLVAADFNGDGFLDIATCNSTAANITVLLGDGKGYFPTTKNIAVTGLGGSQSQQFPKSITAADFNGDGKTDLAIVGHNVGILLGDGTGQFGAVTAYNTVADAGCFYVVADDFNGDGHIDLATANTLKDNISVLLNSGDGTFSDSITYEVGKRPMSIACADLNNDGIKDLAVTNSESGTVSILYGKSSGTFENAINYEAGKNPDAIVIVDFDKDGKPDLAVTNNSGGALSGISILLGNATDFSAPQKFSIMSSNPRCIISADFNNDRLPDIITSNYNSGNNGEKNISVFLNCTETLFTEDFNNNSITVFPNPTDGNIIISSDNQNEETLVSLYNILGEKIYNVATPILNNLSINLSQFPSGIYFVNIKNNDGNFTKKVIKK